MTSRRESSIRQHTFSLYNLSANEIYFEDYATICESTINDDQQKKIKGRLKLCSKSLVFVPHDIRSPMIKILYKQISKFEDSRKNELSLTDSTIVSSNSLKTKNSNSLILICSSVTLMSLNGRIEPYKTDYNTHRFYFEFVYTNVEDCLSVVGQLYRSTTLPFPDQVMMIESIVQGRLRMLKFDLKQLKDLHEKIIFENDAYVIKPLIQNPGRCLLTDQCCYFQALNNINEQQIVKYDLSTLNKITKRRYKFRYIGCELQFKLMEKQQSQNKILYLVFANETICSTFYDLVLSQSSVRIDPTTFENMTLRWQQGTISNYDYLIYLNDRGERSFHDCSQYPVFPWVLRNYTSTSLDFNDPQTFRDLSKPIGALNIERLERLKERYTNMSLPSDHQRFLYGSFYSNPGFIVYFLCRLHPQLSLCLNGGRFDHPDRLFHSIVDTWKSVLTSDSDVKELLPEFYMSSQINDAEVDDDEHRQDGTFLTNQFGIDFGVRHDDIPVGDVVLPPWADNQRDFIYKMRLALECDYVSQHIHEWIDLIFGYKQRGDEARQTDNLFHYLTYGVPENLVSSSTEEYDELLSLETQILEFGQVPKQLFFKPHPRKLTKQELEEYQEQEKNLDVSISSTSIDNNNAQIGPKSFRPRVQSLSSFEQHELGQFEFDAVCRLHKTAVTRIVPHPLLPATHLLTIGDDGFLRNYMVDKTKIDTFFYISSRPLTCLKSISVRLSLNTIERCSLAFIGSNDHALYIYNLETGTSLLSQVLHDDAITDLYITNRSTPTLLCTSSNDATVRFWSLENFLFINEDNYIFQSNYHMSSVIHMQYEISFDSSCTCMSVLEEHCLLAVGSQDGSISLCHFQTGQVLKQLASSSSSLPILSLSLRSDGLFLAYLSATTVTLVDIISGTDVFTNLCHSNEQSFHSLFYSSQMLIVGLINGSCDVWNLKICEKVHSLNICDNIAITTITHNDGMFFFGTEDGSVHSYVFASRQQLTI